MKKDSHSFAATGHVSLGYSADLGSTLREMVDSWKAFCALPENVRSVFGYNAADAMGVGYELKKNKGKAMDLKEDFHYTSGAQEWLATSAHNMKNVTAESLVTHASRLLHALAPSIRIFAEATEREYDLPGFAQEVVDSQGSWFLRLLHYFGDREIGEETATAHADKSGFTLHLYESDPGLQFLDWSKQWRNVPVDSKNAVIIPGMRLQYRSEGRLKAVYHRVVATKKTAREGRFSMVCFVHLNRTPQYDKQRQGRLQEFAPGFNYDMPHEEFKKLFK